MFTNNYIKFKKLAFEADSYSKTESGFKNANGESKSASACLLFASDLGEWLQNARCRSIIASTSGTYPGGNTIFPGVYFGSGSTPATKDDYTLENPITSGLTITNPSVLSYVNNEAGKYEVSADYVLRNNTDADIIIREAGIFTPTVSNNVTSITSSASLNLMLMERTVMAEPITIHPGEAKLATYKITFNHVLNVE